MKGKDLTEKVYRQIKKDLMMRKIPSGELFSEQMLADRYNCSRTPAREAAGRLVAEGFLNKYPSKGYLVKLPTAREMSEMRYCCAVLEAAALNQAFHSAYREEFRSLYGLIDRSYDDEELAYFSNMTFHYELAKLSGNQTITNEIEHLRALMIRGESEVIYRGREFLGDQIPEKSIESDRETEREREKEIHRKIIDALVAQNLVEAKKFLVMDIYPTVPFEEVNNIF